MSSVSSSSPGSRYVALDVHRSYLVVGAVDEQQQAVLTPRRFGCELFRAWASTHLGPQGCGRNVRHVACVGAL